LPKDPLLLTLSLGLRKVANEFGVDPNGARNDGHLV
jgi:hypothetical protein